MKETGFAFETLSIFYRVKLSFSDTKRSQYILVSKSTEEYKSLRVNTILSIVYDSPAEPSPELLAKAFQRRFMLGAVTLETPSEAQKNWRIRFQMDLHAGFTSEKLKEVIRIVGATGDTLETELNPNGGDVL